MSIVEDMLNIHLSKRDLRLRTQEMQIPYLLSQHCQEIIFTENDYRRIIVRSFSTEFIELLQTCIFIPFINENTPKPYNLPKTEERVLKDKKFSWLPRNNMVEELFELLTKIHAAQV
jgi:hypothetical protein